MADYTLADAITYLGKNSYWGGDTLILRDGIFSIDTLTLAGGTLRGLTIQADTGARPIITGTDGYPPTLTIGKNITLKNLWLGGNRTGNGSSRVITLDTGSTIEGCTIWGYDQCIGGNVGNQNTVTKTRFINCGSGGLKHDIYVSNAEASAGYVTENIHVGGEGYKIQLYHNPTGVMVDANFMASSANGDMAIQEGNDIITHNILWNHSAQYWNAGGCVFDHNIFGPDRDAFADVTTGGNTANGNVFCNGQVTFGSNPQIWDAAAIASNLGYTKVQIDTAVSNLITKFAQATAQIYADATVETDFAVLRGVIDAWKDA
jgi:hypothetical protein